jgi:Rrf2 family protein
MTRSGEHGLRIVTALARTGGRLRARRLSEFTGVPRGCTREVAGSLSRAGILNTLSGARGGCRLARAPTDITVLDVLQAVEGLPSLETCLLDGGPHSDPPCALHEPWVRAQRAVVEALGSVTVADLARPGGWPRRVHAPEHLGVQGHAGEERGGAP